MVSMRELAKRATALEGKGWRWMPGMGIWIGGSIVKRCVGVGKLGPIYRNGYGFLSEVPFALPALDDPATLGCLLTLVREAYANAVVITQGNDWWTVETDHYHWNEVNTASFQEALIAALEAAKHNRPGHEITPRIELNEENAAKDNLVKDLCRLSSDMMNLPIPPDREDCWFFHSTRNAYKQGHRDARHAAAEKVNNLIADHIEDPTFKITAGPITRVMVKYRPEED